MFDKKTLHLFHVQIDHTITCQGLVNVIVAMDRYDGYSVAGVQGEWSFSNLMSATVEASGSINLL